MHQIYRADATSLSLRERGLSPKGGEGAAGASPWLLADTTRGREKDAFISSTSSRAPNTRSVGRLGWSAGLPSARTTKVSKGGRWTLGRGGSVGLVGETGIDSILCMVRGERPPPSPVLCLLPPLPSLLSPLSSSSPSRKPTHSGSPGQSSRPPAHCCFFEMGLPRF